MAAENRQREPIAVRLIQDADPWAQRASVLALVISTLALVASASGIYLSLRHSELAVTPLLTVWSQPDPLTPSIRWKATNAGLGPAIIKDIALFVNGQRSKGSIDADSHWSPLDSVQGATRVVNWGELLVPGEGFRVGAEIEPFVLTWPSRAEMEHVDADRLAVLAICYCSFYQNCWYADSRAYSGTPKNALISNCAK
jgi:hypothetical protein